MSRFPIRRRRSSRSVALVFVGLAVFGLAKFLGLVEPGQTMGSAGPKLASEAYERSFTFCPSSSGACVIDGDTFHLDGMKVRIADIDTPELSPPRCDYERELGERAKARLRDLLNAGPFILQAADRDEDKYGRKLRSVHRPDGTSVGLILVREGLARRWDGARHPWCS